jgi:hypothetical protein
MTAKTAAASAPAAEMAPATAATATAKMTATSLPDGACPRCRGALPACEAAFAIPTYLVALADALEGLRLSGAVAAPALVRTDLSLLLAKLMAGGSPRLRTVACSLLPTPLRALPVAYLPLVRAVAAFRPHVGALEITSHALGTAVCQLFPAAFGPPAEGFARITAGIYCPVEFLLAHRIAVLYALAVFDVVLPGTVANVCPVKVVIPVDIDVHVPTSPVAVTP